MWGCRGGRCRCTGGRGLAWETDYRRGGTGVLELGVNWPRVGGQTAVGPPCVQLDPVPGNLWGQQFSERLRQRARRGVEVHEVSATLAEARQALRGLC